MENLLQGHSKTRLLEIVYSVFMYSRLRLQATLKGIWEEIIIQYFLQLGGTVRWKSTVKGFLTCFKQNWPI